MSVSADASRAALPADSARVADLEFLSTPAFPTEDTAQDADDPMAWPATRKWVVTAALSASGFNRIMVSTIMAPALPVISRELGLSSIESVMALSIYVLAGAFSSLLFGPLSEIFGRAPLMHTTNMWFLVFNIACGFAPNGALLIAGRFLAGYGAGAIYSLAAGVLGDLWPPEKRGVSLSIYLLVPLLGVAVGPIVGGFVEQYTSWRWIFWSTSILQALSVAVCFAFARETHLPTIRRKQARRAAGPQGALVSRVCAAFDTPLRDTLLRNLAIPFRQLAMHRSVQVQAALSGFSYGLLYLVLATYSSLFTEQYRQSVAISGLHYISVCLGEVCGSQVGGRGMDAITRLLKRHRAKHMQSDAFEPEFHLPIVAPCIIVSALGLLLYGWSAQAQLPWIVVDIGAFILSAAMQISGQALQAYNMDSYPESRASTTAVVQLFRGLGAFGLPLAAPAMYARLGYGWANLMLASIYVVGNSAAVCFLWTRGATIRTSQSP